MSSQSLWLASSLAYHISGIFQLQCSEWFHLHVSSEKQHENVITSMADGQWFFHLSQQQRRFCHENYLVLSRTQLFHQLTLPKCHIIHGIHIYTQRAFCITASAICMCATFRKQKFMLGSKISWSQPSAKAGSLNLAHEIHVCISSMKISSSMVCMLTHIDCKYFGDFHEGITYQSNLKTELILPFHSESIVHYSDINISYCEKYPKMVKCPYYRLGVSTKFCHFGSVLNWKC